MTVLNTLFRDASLMAVLHIKSYFKVCFCQRRKMIRQNLFKVFIILCLIGIMALLVVVLIIPLVNGAITLVQEYTSTLTVTTTIGSFRGRLALTMFDQRRYYAFKGMPYAEPPLGELRFKV